MSLHALYARRFTARAVTIACIGLLLSAYLPADARAAVSDLERYALAAEHRAAGRWEMARSLAKGVTDPVLAEASAALIGDCLIAEGEYQEADNHYREALARKEFLGLYRGEMLAGRAMTLCLQSTDADSLQLASQWLEEADAWCKQFADKRFLEELRAEALNRCLPAAIEATPLHASPRSATAFEADGVPDVPGAGVVHPLNAGWRVGQVRRGVETLRLYVDSQLGKQPKLTEQEALGLGLYRLRGDAMDGAFLVDHEAWSSLRDDHAAGMRLGLFLIVAGRPDMAAGLFDPVYDNAKEGGLDSNTWAVSALGAGVCALRLDDSKRGHGILGRFNSEFRNTSVTPLARYVLANHLAGGDKQSHDQAYRLYGDIAAQHADSPYANIALLAMAVAAANHNDGAMLSEAQRKLRDASSPAAPEILVRIAETLTVMGSHDPYADMAPALPKRRPGDPEPIEVRVHRDQLILPSVDLPAAAGVGEGVMAASERVVLRCHLLYGSRFDAYDVDGFEVRLSELEPQPSAGKDGRVSFYRVPALWNTNRGGAR